MTTRRHFLARTAAVAAVASPMGLALPRILRAQGAGIFPTDGGEIAIHPVEHASFVMDTPAGTIFVDPVGDPSLYADLGTPDLILITHEHGDHYQPETLAALAAGKTQMIVNPSVYDMLPPELQAKAQSIANGDSTDALGLMIEAVPAYNITAGREQFHPEGRDNGYVLTIDGARVYISGDTEDTPEMRALSDIDVAFISMNLPFTMTADQAAAGAAEFGPAVVYPYHYRGRDGGTQDPAEFARLLAAAGSQAEVRIGDWYPNGLG
jgi:L-ascorbate metabolism protein UlaG (beta-lactamase superfamily)